VKKKARKRSTTASPRASRHQSRRATAVRHNPSRRRAKVVKRARAVPQPLRWNPDPEDVQKSVVKLVLSLIEFIRKLMERQAVRRLEEKTLTPEEIENVGLALMKLEQTIHLIAKRLSHQRASRIRLPPAGTDGARTRLACIRIRLAHGGPERLNIALKRFLDGL
jgi:hypothetical protein